ncbi:hypothetical protein FRX31_014298, partial [Thalictrum thalictroides]
MELITQLRAKPKEIDGLKSLIDENKDMHDMAEPEVKKHLWLQWRYSECMRGILTNKVGDLRIIGKSSEEASSKYMENGLPSVDKLSHSLGPSMIHQHLKSSIFNLFASTHKNSVTLEYVS